MSIVAERPQDAAATEAAATALLAVIAGLLLDSGQAGRHAPPVHLDSSLERDLGVDSLARVELMMRIERAFEVRLPEHLLAAAQTPRDLLRAVQAGGARAPQTDVLGATPIGAAEPGHEALPDTAATLIKVLDWHVAAHPQRAHVILFADGEHGEPISYAELRGEAGRLAGGIADLGIAPGDAVAIMLPNSCSRPPAARFAAQRAATPTRAC